MASTHQGSFRLFRFSGIQVFLHWTWFLVAFYEVSTRQERYSTLFWNVAEYLTLFAIVLLHEFGHALACRSVKGQADEIVLWPLGGLAYVAPPPRPGAQLWSIAAGPLVNALLVPVVWGVVIFSRSQEWFAASPDFAVYLRSIWYINVGLLIFNLLPIFPLDGGQILRSLLWFPLGKARSLQVATIIGFMGVAGLLVLAILRQSLWTGIIALFVFQQCLANFRYAQALLRLERAPKHDDLACPTCHVSPPSGPVFLCGRCGTAYDPFDRHGVCPQCGTAVGGVTCPNCQTHHTLQEWGVLPAVPPDLP
ncbi:peptidase M50 [Opitutaceae bacterium EW11]|nr:peptidase M50 [Opitutaceae bacterium EW11]